MIMVGPGADPEVPEARGGAVPAHGRRQHQLWRGL